MDMVSQYSDDNALLKSQRQEDNLLGQSLNSDAGQPDFFDNEEKKKLAEALKEAHKL